MQWYWTNSRSTACAGATCARLHRCAKRSLFALPLETPNARKSSIWENCPIYVPNLRQFSKAAAEDPFIPEDYYRWRYSNKLALNAFKIFLKSKILWIRPNPPVGPNDFPPLRLPTLALGDTPLVSRGIIHQLLWPCFSKAEEDKEAPLRVADYWDC